jgi:hypothetical protein
VSVPEGGKDLYDFIQGALALAHFTVHLSTCTSQVGADEGWETRAGLVFVVGGSVPGQTGAGWRNRVSARVSGPQESRPEHALRAHAAGSYSPADDDDVDDDRRVPLPHPAFGAAPSPALLWPAMVAMHAPTQINLPRATVRPPRLLMLLGG